MSQIVSVHKSSVKNSLPLNDKDEPKAVEVLIPPENSKPGDKVYIDGYSSGSPDEVLNPKKKVWEKLQEHLKTSANCEALWKDHSMKTDLGVIKCASLKNAPIK